MSEFTAPEVETMGLMRSMPFDVVRSEDNGDGLTLEGYAAVFNSPTRINSWEGNFDEVILPGAFKRSLDRKTPVLMFNHGQHPLIGDMPLGKIDVAKEDARGVFIRARLSNNWLIQPVRDAIAEGSVSGMSFRFSVRDEAWQPADVEGGLPLRQLKMLDVAELGPVVFPAYTDTSVGVRSQEVAGLLGDPEFRTALARVLLLGTPDEPARDSGTSDGPATEAAPEPRVTTPIQVRRQRALQIKEN